MLNKYFPLKGIVALLLLFLMNAAENRTSAQCTITPATAEGCLGVSVGFTVSGAAWNPSDPGITYQWDLAGTANTSDAPSHTFSTPGTKNVCVKVFKNGVEVCNTCISFVVNKNPVANFSLDPSMSAFQCYTGNYYTFLDLSTQGEPGNPITSAQFHFGDGNIISGAVPGPGSGPWSQTYFLQTGQTYTHLLRIEDSKGCKSEISKTIAIVDDDIDVDFSTNDPMQCYETVTNISNTTLLPLNRITSFSWDFGDGTIYNSSSTTGNFNGVDSCRWLNPVHVYKDHGCFTVSLTAENDSGCKDTKSVPNFQCNINPNMELGASPAQAQCFTGNNFVMTSQVIVYPGMNLTSFLWNFDDPDAMLLNFDDLNLLAAPHEFTKPDLFEPFLTVEINGCQFVGKTAVLTKGPGATIENKMIPDIIHDTMRHQCQIKDTVYFPNNSSFFLNDRTFVDDTSQGAATIIDKSDEVYLLYRDSSVLLNENVVDNYYVDGDTFYVVPSPLQDIFSYFLIYKELKLYQGYYGAITGERKAENIKLVWDFDDAMAPNCTTWTAMGQDVYDYSRPFYHYINDRGIKVYYDPVVETIDWSKVTDTTYAWKNCRYSRDPLPKHWYTPGEERCYSVRLTIADTTIADPADSISYTDGSGAVMNKDFYRFGKAVTYDTTYGYPPLLDGSGNPVMEYSPYCPAEILGPVADTSKPKDVVLSVTPVYATEWPNPNVQNGENCESVGTVSLALGAPEATGLKWRGRPCYGPAPPNGIFFNWQDSKPGCTQQFIWFHFDSLADRKDATPNAMDQWRPQNTLMLNPMTSWAMGTMNMPTWPTEIFNQYGNGSIADSCGFLTVGLRIQNGKNPNNNQPCIDEKWYNKFIRYSLADPSFNFTPKNGCKPMEIEVELIKDVQDSVESITFAYQNTDPNQINDFQSEVDSVFRNVYDPVTNDTINYVLTYKVDNTGTARRIDSVTFIPGVGGIAECGNEIRFKKKRKHTFEHSGRYNLSVGITTIASNQDPCNRVTTTPAIVVIGFYSELTASKKTICRNETVDFTDSTLYYLKDPDPFTGDILRRYNYWHKPEQETYHDGITPRTWPASQREKFWYNFDQGAGFVAFQGTPTQNPISVSYPIPGFYNIQAAFVDSLGCSDTVEVPLTVTGTSANFEYSIVGASCDPAVRFFDSSVMLDPCYLRTGNRCDSIIRWRWDYGDGRSISTDNQNGRIPIVNPTHVYREFGDYDVTLIIETALGCFDTIVRTVTIEGPRPRIEFAIDSVGCAPYTAHIRNTSYDPPAGATWTYYFGDNTSLTTTSDSNVSHVYTTPGTYVIRVEQTQYVNLAGQICMDTFPTPPKEVKLRVLPDRKVDFSADRLEVCPKDSVFFTENSDTIYSSFQWIIQRNPGGTEYDTFTRDSSVGRQIGYAWKEPGQYIVRLKADYTPAPGDPKCLKTKSIQIIVREVKASFTVDSTAANKPNFFFTNTSTNANAYWWRFGDGEDYVKCPLVDMDNCPNATHNYGDNIGTFEVCLVAQSPEGCYDTACEMVNNYYEIFIDIPNVFTPNGDGFNDSFKVDFQSLVKYEITIFNRWGTKVYESTDPNSGWNGKNKNTGQDCPAGSYYVIIKYQLRGQSEQEYNGTCTLIR